MTIDIRRCAARKIFAILLLWVAAGAAALAQPAGGDYPAKIVRIIAPYAPGGQVDALSRVIAMALSERFGKSFIVENRPGAGGNIGLALLAKSPGDGYTLGIAAANMLASNRALYSSLPFDTIRDFAPIAYIGSVPFVLVIRSSLPAQNLAALIALMKANANDFSYGSSGIGNTAHLFGELLKKKASVDMVHVPYKSSGEAFQELLGGRVQLVFSTLVDVQARVERGTVRPIALASARRAAALPNVPTFTELGMTGFEAPTWFGVIGPRGIPDPVISFLNRELQQAFARPDVKARLVRLGLETGAMTAEQFGAFIHSELEKWETIVKESGARVD